MSNSVRGRASFVRRLVAIAAGVVCLTAFVGHAQAQSYGYATYTAVVNNVGGIFHSNGVVSSTSTQTGRVEVTFSRPIGACTSVISVYGTTVGYATGNPSANNPSILVVNTFGVSGARANLAFSVIVSCGP